MPQGMAEVPLDDSTGEARLIGSIHTLTNGIGYGAWRTGPQSERFETARGERMGRWNKMWRADVRDGDNDGVADEDVVKSLAFARTKGWKHTGPNGDQGRMVQARRHLTSGEVGLWSSHEVAAEKGAQDTILPKTPPRKYPESYVPKGQRLAGATLFTARTELEVEPTERKPRVPKGEIPGTVRRHLERTVPSFKSSSVLDMKSDKLDPIFGRTLLQDLAHSRDPVGFNSKLPCSGVPAHSAFYQNELSSSLTTHWSHSLRGQKY